MKLTLWVRAFFFIQSDLTALHLAALHNHIETVDALVRAHANVEARAIVGKHTLKKSKVRTKLPFHGNFSTG